MNTLTLPAPSVPTPQGPLPSLGLDLRSLSGKDKAEQISQIATQFEEMLLQTLIKDTFKTPTLFGDETPWMSTMSSLQPMLLSQYLAEQGGLGYRGIIEEQLLEKIRLMTPESEKSSSLNQTLRPRFTPHAPVSAPLSSNFGWRSDPFTANTAFHAGVDFAVPQGTSIQTIGPGTVSFSGRRPGYGDVVEIDHGDGFISRYARNSSNLVTEGDRVEAGTVIALSGSSGRSTGPHLHLEIRHHGRPVDPQQFFPSV
jgi:murein DD-endopeptidase MepM/ murein hydrolase activator NlpD